MRVILMIRSPLALTLAVIAASCNNGQVTTEGNGCIKSSLPSYCCGPDGYIKPEIIGANNCSTADAATKQLAAECGTPDIAGDQNIANQITSARQNIIASGAHLDLNTGLLSDSDNGGSRATGGDPDPSGFWPGKTSGAGGGPKKRTGSDSGSGSSGNSNSGDGGGFGGGGGGGGGLSDTKKRSGNDGTSESGQLGVGSDNLSGGTAYGSGGGGGGGSKGGGSGGSSLLSSLSGMFGGGAGGKGDKAGGAGDAKFGVQTGAGGRGGADGAMGSADPDDYFTRIGVDDSLFHKVELRYEQATLKGALSSPGSLGAIPVVTPGNRPGATVPVKP